MLKMMQTKYEAAMKEKMLVKLERDRLARVQIPDDERVA